MKIYHFIVYVTDNLTPVVIRLDHYFHPVYVPMRDQVILTEYKDSLWNKSSV